MLDLSQITPQRSEPYPFTELQLKCIEDLETTQEAQATGTLEAIDAYGVTKGFCCLGRFCTVLGVRRQPMPDQGCTRYWDEPEIAADGTDMASYGEGSLPGGWAKKLGLYGGGGNFLKPVQDTSKSHAYSLWQMNDSLRMSFKEIAAYIRHDPWNVFEAPEAREANA